MIGAFHDSGTVATCKAFPSEALEKEPSRRAGFLAEACAGDDTLRGEIEDLLAAQERAGSFLEEPVLKSGLPSPVVQLSPGTRLGTYEVRALIGAGRMGEVYRASDTRLGRDIAIKVLPGAFTATQIVLRALNTKREYSRR